MQVVTLVNKMERLRGSNLQMGIHKSLVTWQEAILQVQERRRKEVINTLSNRSSMPSHHFPNEQGSCSLKFKRSRMTLSAIFFRPHCSFKCYE